MELALQAVEAERLEMETRLRTLQTEAALRQEIIRK